MKQIERSAVAGVTLRLLGQFYHGIKLTEEGIVVLARSPI